MRSENTSRSSKVVCMEFRLSVIFGFVLLNLLSCGVIRENQEMYDVKIGQKVKIYYRGNSCCGRCWNLEELRSVELIESKTLKKGRKPGSSSVYVMKFKAVSSGIDTLKTHYYAMSGECDLNSGSSEMFIIKIRE